MSERLLNTLRAALGGKYALLRQVGQGALGIVFQAEDRFGRVVALKLVRPELVEAVGSKAVLQELATGARLSHPHILPVLACGEVDGNVYYVTPYVSGGSLRQRLDREGRISVNDGLRIVREVADAVSYAHSHNVIHRDINPHNVLLEDDHAIVKDFWIARALAIPHPEQLFEQGLVLGSPPYMSPEQASGTPDIDARSDVYSLACLLHEMELGTRHSALGSHD